MIVAAGALALSACEQPPKGPSELDNRQALLACSSGMFRASRAARVEKPRNESLIEMSRLLQPCRSLSDDQLIGLVKEEIKEDLKDPFSVKYKDVRVSGILKVEGQYAAKNSYGAYTGFKRFDGGISRQTGKMYLKTYDY